MACFVTLSGVLTVFSMNIFRVHIKLFYVLLVGLGLLLAGCRAEQAQPPQTPALPQKAAQFIAQAQEALAQEAYTRGLAWADSAVAYAPFAPEGHFIRGRLNFAMGRLDEAQAAYLKAQEVQPDYPGIAHNLGNVAFQQRRYRDALALYTRETEHGNDPNPWHGLGGTHEALGHAAEAFTAYTKALAVDPNYAPAHASLAQWHEREGQFGIALTHAQRALALDTANLAYRYKVGALLHRTGADAEALPHLRAVLDAQPWNYQAASNLGQVLQKLGADHAEAMLNYANTLRAKQSDVARYARIARTSPENFQAQLTYADALRQTGRLTEARSAYHVALSLRPYNLSLQTNIATLYAQMGHTAEAEARLTHILQADSTQAEAWLNLGLLYGRAGKRAEAEAALQRAFHHGKDNPTVTAFRQRMAETKAKP